MFCTFVFAQEMCRPSSELAASMLSRVLVMTQVTFKGCDVIRVV